MPGESEARLGQGGSRTARCPRMQGLCPLHGRLRRSPGVRRENTKAQGWVPLQAQAGSPRLLLGHLVGAGCLSVASGVLLQVVRTCKVLVTPRAEVRTLPGVLSLVPPELIGTGEAPGTALHVADIGLVASVDALVDLEFGGLAVHFGTTLEWARIVPTAVIGLLVPSLPGLLWSLCCWEVSLGRRDA